MSCWPCAHPNVRSQQFNVCFFFVGFSTGWFVTGGAAERAGTILRTITAAGSRTMSCWTSPSWGCFMNTWRWVRYFTDLVYSTEIISGQEIKDRMLSFFLSLYYISLFSTLPFYITNSVCLLCSSFQWSSLVSSRCLWPLSPWLRSWLCSTTSWRSGWMPGSSPPSSDDRWRPRPETSERGRKSSTQWQFCLLLPTWVLYV